MDDTLPSDGEAINSTRVGQRQKIAILSPSELRDSTIKDETGAQEKSLLSSAQAKEAQLTKGVIWAFALMILSIAYQLGVVAQAPHWAEPILVKNDDVGTLIAACLFCFGLRIGGGCFRTPGETK